GARGTGVVLPDPRDPATTSLHRCYRILLPYSASASSFSHSLVTAPSENSLERSTAASRIRSTSERYIVATRWIEAARPWISPEGTKNPSTPSVMISAGPYLIS